MSTIVPATIAWLAAHPEVRSLAALFLFPLFVAGLGRLVAKAHAAETPEALAALAARGGWRARVASAIAFAKATGRLDPADMLGHLVDLLIGGAKGVLDAASKGAPVVALVAAFALFVGACAPLTRPIVVPPPPEWGGGDMAVAPDPAVCEALASQHRTEGGAAATGAALGGIGGLAAGLDDGNKNGRLILGITSLLIGGLAAGAQWMSSEAASEWSARGCGAALPSSPTTTKH